MTMPTGDQTDGQDLMDQIIQDVLDCRRRGERPEIEECLARHPGFAAELRAILPAMILIEDLKSANGDGPSLAYGGQLDSTEATEKREDASPGPMAGWNEPGDTLRFSKREEPGSSGLPPTFGDYRLGPMIGQGGMGVVYRADQISLNRTVALKMLRGGLFASDGELRRFKNEAEAIAALDHPNIVPIFEVGEHRGIAYFTMKLIDGHSLDRRPDSLDDHPDDAARLMAKVARAIHHAHQRGILHRDLKPANILLDSRGEPLVTDFGLAKRTSNASELTQTDACLGTPAYMAPEQVKGPRDGVTTATDVYGLGATLFALLTGEAPHRGTSILDTLAKVREETPPHPWRINPRVSHDLGVICLKCLEKDPGRRYASAEALAEDLDRLLDGEPVEARSVGLAERAWRWGRRRPAIAGLLFALVAAIALGFAGMARLTVIANRNAESASLNEGRAQRLARTQAAARIQSQRREADLSLSKGIALAEEGYIGRGLLWMSEALRIAPPEAEALRGVARRNIASWRDRSIVPRSILATGQAKALAFSPDGRTLATGGDDGILRLWDVATGKALASTRAHKGKVQSTSFRPDGRSLVSCGTTDGATRLWSSGDLRRIGEFVLPDNGSQPVAAEFRPDGRALLTISGSKHVARFLDADTGRQIGEPMALEGAIAGRLGPDGRSVFLFGALQAKLWSPEAARPIVTEASIWDAAFSPDGRFLAVATHGPSPLSGTGRERGEIRVWDIASRSEVSPRSTHRLGYIRVAFHPEGKRLAAAGVDDVVRLLDVATGEQLGKPMPHLGELRRLAFSPDGRTLLTASRDGTARLFDGEAGQPLGSILEHGGEVVEAAFSPDGRTIATACLDGAVRTWDISPAALLARVAIPPVQLETVESSPDGSLLATTGQDSTARLTDSRTGSGHGPILTHPARVRAARFRPDGRTIATACDDGNVRLWDVADGHLIAKMPSAFRHWVVNLRFSPDGRTLLAGQVEGHAQLFDVANCRPIGKGLVHPGTRPGEEVWNLAFSPDGRVAITGSTDGSLRAWNASDGRPVAGAATSGEISWLEAGRDGRTLFVLAEGRVHRLDLTTLQPAGDPWGNRIEAIALSPDGRTLLGGGSDRIALLRDASTGETIGPAMEHDGNVRGVAFNSDGSTLATLTAGGRLRFWDSATGKPVGPPFDHPGWAVTTRHDDRSPVAFLPDDRSAVTIGGGVIVWAVPRPGDSSSMPPDVEAIVALSGLSIDAQGGLRTVDPGRWAGLIARRGPPGTTPDDDWHRRMAFEAELHEDARGLAWHIERIDGLPTGAWSIPARWRSALADSYAASGRREDALKQREAALAESPANDSYRERRAVALVELGRYRLAAEDFARLSQLDPKITMHAYHRSLLLALAGDLAAHRQATDSMLAGIDRVQRPIDRIFSYRARCLVPGPPAGFEGTIRLIQKDAAAIRQELNPGLSLGNYVLGLTEYRAGRYVRAIRHLETSEKVTAWPASALNWPVLAMAHHRLGHDQEARKWWAKARRRLEDERWMAGRAGPDRAVPDWWDRAEFRLYCREAEVELELPANVFAR